MQNVREKNERYDRAALEAELLAAGAIEIHGQYKCPFHEDRNPSGSIYEGKDSVWRYKCFATGCFFHTPGDIYDVRAKRMGQTTAQVLRMDDFRSSPVKEKPVPLDDLIKKIQNVESIYRYTNPDTRRVDMAVVRHIVDGKKSFKQIRSEGNGFVFGAPIKPWPLYNRARLRQTDTVFVCEGEKAVHALHDVGVVATTAPGGAGKAAHADWTPLAGKTAVLWPDNDPPDANGRRTGIEHMTEAAAILQTIEPPVTVRWIDPDILNLPPKGDAFEFVQAIPGDSAVKRDAVLDLLSGAVSLSAANGFFDLLDDISSGRYANIPLPWKALSNLTRCFLPGTVTLICGSPGATKSFFLDSMLIHFHEQDIKFCAYKLEDDLPFHLNRIFAMKAGISDYLNPDWIKANPEDTRIHAERLRPFLDAIGRRIQCAPPEGISLEDMGKWIETKAREGNRIIAVDPVTAAGITGNRQWESDKNFMMKAKGACRDNGSSLVLVTHPKQKKIIGRPTMDDLAGGAAYQRFAHTILWIVNHGHDKRVSISGKSGDFSASINRTIHIEKSRNGKGSGFDLGFRFDPDRLSFEEIGIIQPKKSHSNCDDDSEIVPF
jgi:hypothetical protein